MTTPNSPLPALLISGAEDELGLDVDRFRNGASDGSRYLSGLEFAFMPAAVIVLRFFRGFVAGAKARAAERGFNAQKLGESMGSGTVDLVADQLNRWVVCAEKDLKENRQGDPNNLRGAIDEMLSGELGEMREMLNPETKSAAVKDIADFLADYDFDHERAEELAVRIADHLAAKWKPGV